MMRMRSKLMVLAKATPVIALGTAAFEIPMSVEDTQLNTACFRHRRCDTEKFGLSRVCHMYTDAMEVKHRTEPTGPPESCGESSWFSISSCSYYLSGTVVCALHPKRGPPAAIQALQFLEQAQRTHMRNTGHFLTEAEAHAQWSPRGEYVIEDCLGEHTSFSAASYHVVLAAFGNAARKDCWVLDSEVGVRRLTPE